VSRLSRQSGLNVNSCLTNRSFASGRIRRGPRPRAKWEAALWVCAIAASAGRAGAVGPPTALPPPQITAADEKSPVEDERFNIHFQATVVSQYHPAFSALYSGRNSMRPDAESKTSVVMDIFTGLRLWKGAELYFQPELAAGLGLSTTLGVADFPSGEVYRVGDPKPVIIPARLFLRQVIGLGGGAVVVQPGPSQLRTTRDRNALTLTVGKVSTPDFVDRNPYSYDPHTQFLSWGLWASAAYDYPADTRGYTWGVAADLSIDWWSVRAGMFLEPQYSNLMPMEWRIDKARGLAFEVEARYTVAGLKGAVRALGFYNDARMGSYRLAIEHPGPNGPDVTASRAFGRTKAGFAASANQELGGGLGAFMRISYDDGANETWAFTEVDRSAAVGIVQSGSRWGRDGDELGAALVVSGLASIHRQYLAAGGFGFIIGDGRLDRSGPEILGEVYYRALVRKELSIGINYQPVFNPAYNRDRGPIHIFSGRVHVEF